MAETLQILAIRAGEGSTGARKLVPNKPYYFLEGYDIVDDKRLRVRKERLQEVNIYNDFFQGESNHPSVHISAIVGKTALVRVQ